MRLTGAVVNGGNDTVTMSVGNPPTIHFINAPDNMLTLAGHWQVAEFNIFGERSAFFVVHHPNFSVPLYLLKADAVRLQ